MENETLARIQRYLSNQPDVIAAYLFGSAAANLDHAQSDVDVALLLPEHLSRSAALELQLKVMADLEDICSRQVDVVILNTASPLLCFQVFKHGRLLAERDRKGRALFECGRAAYTTTLSLTMTYRYRSLPGVYVKKDSDMGIEPSLVYEHLTHRLDDFEAFARAILRFVEGG